MTVATPLDPLRRDNERAATYPRYPYALSYRGPDHYSGPETPAAGGLDLQLILRALWRWKWVVILTPLFCLQVAAIGLSFVTERFVAETVVVLEEQSKQPLNFMAEVEGRRADSASIESQVEIIRSRNVAESVVADLDLENRPEFNARLLPSPEQLPKSRAWPSLWQTEDSVSWFVVAADMKNALFDRLDHIVYRIKFGAAQIGLQEPAIDRQMLAYNAVVAARGSDVAPSEGAAAAGTTAVSENVLREFARRLTVRQKGRSRAIAISFSSAHPVTAAEIANRVAAHFLQEQVNRKLQRLQTGKSWLDAQLTEIRNNVEEAERAIETYRSEAGLLKGGRGTLVSQQITQINAQLIETRSERAALEARLSTIQDLIRDRDTDSVQSVTDILNSELIQELREQEITLRRQKADLASIYGPRHPNMIRIENEIAGLAEKIGDEMRKILRSLRNDASAVRAKETAILGSLEAMKAELRDVNQADVQLRALEREAEASCQILNNFLGFYKQTQAQGDGDILQPDASVISTARPPRRAAYPNKALVLSASGFTGLVLAGCLIVFLQQLDKGFRSGQQIETMTGLPYLGLTPKIGRGKVHGRTLSDYVIERPNTSLSEAFRSLYMSIVLSDCEVNRKVIAITSSKPSEGKSTTAVTLARTIAATGKKTLLIDGDGRMSSVAQFMNIPVSPGLSDLLAGGTPFQEAIRTDKATGLDILAAGAFSTAMTGLLESDAMAGFLNMARKKYDFILIDCPPVMAVAESRLLARMSDGVLLAVRWGITPRDAVSHAVRELTNANCQIIGCLVTMVDVKQYAHYGYGDSGRYSAEEAKYYARQA